MLAELIDRIRRTNLLQVRRAFLRNDRHENGRRYDSTGIARKLYAVAFVITHCGMDQKAVVSLVSIASTRPALRLRSRVPRRNFSLLPLSSKYDQSPGCRY